MKKNWHIVNAQPNKENPALSDGQICTNQAAGSPAVNFNASDPNLLTRLLSDAEIGSHMIEIITNKGESKVTDQSSNLGFFCCNTSNPEKYTEAGFVAGPVMPTKYASSAHIESHGYTGIYTRLDDPSGTSRYRDMTGLPIPDKHSELFPGLDYEVNQMTTNEVTVQDILNQEVTTGNYSTWTEDELVSEIMSRRLVHGVSIASFPVEQMRLARLVEMLEGNDRLMDHLKECVK